MTILTQEEYDFIFNRLKGVEDVELLHKRLGLPKDLLFNILGKKIVRDTTKRFYLVKRKSRMLLGEWKRGISFTEIARELNFPPVLMANFILEEKRISKNRIRDYMRNPDAVRDDRLRKELKEALKNEIAYSPNAGEIQAKNGKNAEKKIEVWLKGRKINFLSEVENRAISHHARTPDFLLEHPIRMNGFAVNWVESKASFGDNKELERDSRRQIKDYIKYFGPGALVYWYGYVEGLKMKDVLILSDDFFSQVV